MQNSSEADKELRWVPSCPVWDELVETFLSSDTGIKVKKFIQDERAEGKVIYPSPDRLFRALRLCPYENTKVVIIGQDPYHDGSADGLAFSAGDSKKRPPSLKVIFQEIIESEYPNGVELDYVFKSNDLSSWAKQGVLLINTALTVEAKKAGSHSKIGWDELIKAIIEKINEKQKPVVFMLWGSHAKAFQTAPHHLRLEGVHPQAQNYNPTLKFVGNKHFRKCAEFLVKNQILNINWRTL